MKLLKYNTFISYPSPLKSYAQEIAEYLTGSGLKVYWDKYLDVGDEVISSLSAAIKDSNSVLVIIGPNGMGPWQSKEVDFTCWDHSSRVEHEKKRIIPIIVQGGSMDHGDIPQYIKGLRFLEFKDDIKNSPVTMQEVIRSILKLHVPIIDDFERPITFDQAEGLIHDTVEFYNTYADDYYDAWKNKIPLGAMEPFLGALSKQDTILDAGCGPGHHALHLHNEGYQVQGIDLSSQALKIASKHNKSIEFNHMDMRNMQYERNNFDAVWACGSTVHLPREMMVNQLFEFLRVIKPGGFLGLSVHVKKPCEKKPDGRFFESYRNKDELIKLLEYCMFDIVSVRETTTTDNTMSQKRVKTWVDIVAQAPLNKRIQNI